MSTTQLEQQLAKLDADEHNVRNAGKAAEQDRARAALALAKSPTDKKLRERVAEFEEEIAGHRRDLSRITAARQAAREADALDTHEARAKRIEQAKADALIAKRAQLRAVKAAEKALADLGDALVDVSTYGIAAWEMVAAAAATTHREHAISNAIHLQGTAHGNVGALIYALHQVMERDRQAGGKLGQFITFHGVTEQPFPLAECTRELAHLERELSEMTPGEPAAAVASAASEF